VVASDEQTRQDAQRDAQERAAVEAAMRMAEAERRRSDAAGGEAVQRGPGPQ
jgi:hypothetical protein